MLGFAPQAQVKTKDSNAQDCAAHRVKLKGVVTQSFRGSAAASAETLLFDRDRDTAETGRCHGVPGGEGRRIFRRRFRTAGVVASARHGGWKQRHGDEGKLRVDTRTARIIMPCAGLGSCARQLWNLQRRREGRRHAPVGEGGEKEHGNEAIVHARVSNNTPSIT